MLLSERVVSKLPARVRSQVDAWVEAAEIFTEIRDPKVARALGPSGVRGLLLKRGKQGVPTKMKASHSAHFLPPAHPAHRPHPAHLPRHRVPRARHRRRQCPCSTRATSAISAAG